MAKETKYWCLLVATMMVVGAGYAYQENSVKFAAEADAIGAIEVAEDVFWLADAIGRFGGGVLAYFTVKSINAYIFALGWAGCSLIGNLIVFAIIIVDIDSGILVVLLSFFQGLGIGGMWVVVPQILIDDAGDEGFGKNWGLSILFAYIGMFLFDLLIYWQELAVLTSILFVVMGIVALVCTFIGWKEDEKK